MCKDCPMRVTTMKCAVLCLVQDFWGTPVPKFQGDIFKFWGNAKFIQFLPFKFELEVESFGSRRCVDGSAVVYAIAVVFNKPASFLFLYFNSLDC